ncbi:hypothetical protein ACFWEJ_06685 [Promicromonospora sp. NPDC060204]|uniref:hypothetical protein n=1 Tax=Promicromonospora sp. NPDC060204 TaxID=3347071 RepID=UPI003649862A
MGGTRAGSGERLRLVTEEFGRIEVDTVALPEGALDTYATYTPSGRIFLLYRRSNDPVDEQIFHAATIEDDGTGYHHLFSGPVAQHPRANGIRAMMLPDNRRALLGDYMLECDPDLDTATAARLVDVRYPWRQEEDPGTTHHWSEVIVSPDGEHVSWTILRADMGAAVGLGRLSRTVDAYEIMSPQLISTVEQYVADPEHPGCMLPQPSRGGEVKQFVRGGRAISAVGGVDGFLPDSVVQALDSGDLTAVTRGPGYDETTIFSPDETLGLVMTARASRATDLAVLGLLPRPRSGHALSAIAWTVYSYSVTGVRNHRPGNVGPVLIDIARSRADPGYQGVALHDPAEEWVYVSPMSWHPDGTRCAWLETPRGSELSQPVRDIRIRRARLLDVTPGEPVRPVAVPDDVVYALRGDAAEQALWNPPQPVTSARVAGRHSGYLEIDRTLPDAARGTAGTGEVRYAGYSDDGVSVWNGFERVTSAFTTDTVYEADLVLAGPVSGEMRLRATWTSLVGPDPARLRFEQADDGKAASHGYARYGDQRREVSALLP